MLDVRTAELKRNECEMKQNLMVLVTCILFYFRYADDRCLVVSDPIQWL